MNKHSAIGHAIDAGILSDKNVIAFDFAGNYRTHEIKEGEVVFEHMVNYSRLHWIIAA